MSEQIADQSVEVEAEVEAEEKDQREGPREEYPPLEFDDDEITGIHRQTREVLERAKRSLAETYQSIEEADDLVQKAAEVARNRRRRK